MLEKKLMEEIKTGEKAHKMLVASSSVFISKNKEYSDCTLCVGIFKELNILPKPALSCYKIYLITDSKDELSELYKVIVNEDFSPSKLFYRFTDNKYVGVIYADSKKKINKALKKVKKYDLKVKTELVRGCRHLRSVFTDTDKWDEVFEIFYEAKWNNLEMNYSTENCKTTLQIGFKTDKKTHERLEREHLNKKLGGK